MGLFVSRTGLAPGPPDADPADWVVERGLGSLVASLAAQGDAAVREQVAFHDGALSGHGGELVLDPNSAPHVWALAGPPVVTVAGNLDRAELIRVAESLRRQ
jgi:hypothetical protein